MGDAADGRARSRFQSGLLAWLRQPDDPTGLREMVAVVRSLCAGDAGMPASGLVLWRSAENFLTSLLDGRRQTDDEARRLCRRIERQLAAHAQGQAGDEKGLCAALFADVSNKPAGLPIANDIARMASAAGGLGQLGATLSVTAELLPLFAGSRPVRYGVEQVDRWLGAARHFDDAWHHMGRHGIAPVRHAATELVGVALELGDAACLRLAEALATAIGCAEDPAWREDPDLRAAVAAGLELAVERDGPNLPAFDRRSRAIAERLARVEDNLRTAMAARRATDRHQLFADQARRHIIAAQAAIEARPPAVAVALDALAWFAEDHGAGNVLAIRGLAVQLLQARTPVVHSEDGVATLARVCDALQQAIDDLSWGRPPRPDDIAFAAVRRFAAMDKPSQGLSAPAGAG